MGDFMAHTAAAGVHLRICQVDAVAQICHLIAFPGSFLYRESYLIQACLSANPTCTARERAAYSAGVIDSASLWSVMDTGKRRSKMCIRDRP